MKSSVVKIDLEKSWDFFIALSTNKDCPDNRRGRRRGELCWWLWLRNLRLLGQARKCKQKKKE
ncbi:hypothetical protein NC652_032540 [Populus alba x Populus x berolinensis]|nr:hypothetical protein NC652_032540 [Populus alba x Populus x berolinensis]